MAGKILGIPIASRHQQWRTAKAIFGLIGGIIVLGAVVVGYIASMEQRGRVQAMATVTDFEVRCRYNVRNIGRRSSFYDHTGYIDCASAEQVARDNNFPLGRVERATFANITFKTEGGAEVRTHVELHKHHDIEVGSRVEILYRETTPTDVTEFKNFPLFGKSSIAPYDETAVAQAATRQAALTAASDAAAAAKAQARAKRIADRVARKETDPVGLAILIVLLVVGYFLVRRIWRFVRGLFGSSQPSSTALSAQRGKAVAATSSPAGAARLDRITQRKPRQGFGTR